MNPLLKLTFERLFLFRHQVLYGSSHIRSRWRKCVALAVDYMGLPIGRLFVQKHFDEEAKSGVRMSMFLKEFHIVQCMFMSGL